MPLRLPDKLPAIELLKHENIFVMDESRAHNQEIRPLKICVLNLMPLKITTETDLVRLLSNTPLQLEVYFMKLKSHTPKNTPIEHMMMFYKDFAELSKQKFDGMIVTGAPIETMEYEEVEYWPESRRYSIGHVPTLPLRCISAGVRRLDSITFMVFQNISLIKRSLASSLRNRLIRHSLSSVVLMTSSICHTAAIQRCAGKTSKKCRDWILSQNLQRVA